MDQAEEIVLKTLFKSLSLWRAWIGEEKDRATESNLHNKARDYELVQEQIISLRQSIIDLLGEEPPTAMVPLDDQPKALFDAITKHHKWIHTWPGSAPQRTLAHTHMREIEQCLYDLNLSVNSTREF